MNFTALRAPLPRALLAGLTSVMLAALAACGGGGSSSTDTTSSTSGPQTYSGTVSGLGSIVVNGVRFSTTGATTTDSDDPSQPYTRAFKLGATVVVKGSVDGSDGQATSIEVIGGIRGLVTDVNLANGTMLVAGQLVKFDTNTVIDGEGDAAFTLTWLAANWSGSSVAVEVYGTVDASGAIVATRIEKKDPAALVYAVKGYVVPGSINTTTKHFSMLIKRGFSLAATPVDVDYSTANVLPNGAELRDGVAVRVLSSANPAGQTSLTASKLLIKSDRGVNGSAAKLHGVVTSISGTTWTIGDVTIDVSQNPILRGFSSLAEVLVGTEVRVAGQFKNNVLTAKFVESDDYDRDHEGGAVKLFGVATDVDAVNNTFVVQGVTVKIASVVGLPVLTLPTEGAYVEVLATQINGVLTAVRLQSPSTPRPFEVFGTTLCTNGVSDLQTNFALTLLARTVNVDGRNATIKAEERVNLAASDTPKTCLLEVKGTSSTTAGVTTIAATKIEIKRRY